MKERMDPHSLEEIEPGSFLGKGIIGLLSELLILF
jgi:hypothetical protein